jgi:ubiquinone/menaquinone biosynthesis C-methylase UbiE
VESGLDRGGDGLFRGTAWHYARFRPGYPDALIDLLVERFGLDGDGRLLDLGCGTGQLGLPLARHVREAVGMDPEPEMLSEAAAAAERAGIRNARWVRGGSADVATLGEALGWFRLVTMGRSFHWMDGPATLRALNRVVEPDGGIAIVEEDRAGAQRSAWRTVVNEVVERWQGEAIRAGALTTYASPKERHAEIVAGSPFDRLETHEVETRRVWDEDGVVGFLFSTTFGSLVALGERREPFERELRARLRQATSPEGFVEEGRLRVLLAWRG